MTDPNREDGYSTSQVNTDVERRAHPRHRSRHNVVLRLETPAGEPADIPCSSVDISISGIRLLLDREVAAGTPVEIWVKIPNQSRPLALRGEARWSRLTAEDGMYWLGVELEPMPHQVRLRWESLFGEG